MHQAPSHAPVGDRGLLVMFGNTVSLEVNRKVHSLFRAISRIQPHGVEECVPTYCSLLIYYDPSKTSHEELEPILKELESKLNEFDVLTKERVVEVPVAYGGNYGPDIDYVAEHNNIGRERVAQIHSSGKYRVYMVGFVAGFPYMGDIDARIATPRLKTPRLRVPAGSVAIAERQTGIYPCESPGGWRIIGRTPLRIFNVEEEPPALILPGDTVKFRHIKREEFEEFQSR